MSEGLRSATNVDVIHGDAHGVVCRDRAANCDSLDSIARQCPLDGFCAVAGGTGVAAVSDVAGCISRGRCNSERRA